MKTLQEAFDVLRQDPETLELISRVLQKHVTDLDRCLQSELGGESAMIMFELQAVKTAKAEFEKLREALSM